MVQVQSRQARRLEDLAERGISQANILVHESNKLALDHLRPHLMNADSAVALSSLVTDMEAKAPTNVAQVSQLSPFRYPGGKTWFVPTVRRWLTQMEEKPKRLLEPFAGGAMIGLSAANERLVEHVELVELDDDVAAVWECIINGSDQDTATLVKKITAFEVTLENVQEIIAGKPRSIYNRAFRTIVKNRVQRGGILAPGAGLVKNGEGGKGLSSRWYPETLVKRIQAIRAIRNRITFTQGDAFEAIARNQGAVLFLDPPYTAAGKKAGKRLYTHNDLDHEQLFEVAASNPGPALLTYDDTPEVRAMAASHGFLTGDIAMKSTHHVVMRELAIFKS